jgi:microsomal epoxide hydrolase
MSYSPPASAKPFNLAISDADLSDFQQLLKLSKLGPNQRKLRRNPEMAL